MNHGSLFSGIGGFDLAAECMGWNNIFHCEINPFGQKVLKYYWPNAISYEDITKTDFTIHRGSIDILTGGFPCQPFSLAGKRKGTEDPRNLWPEYYRAIREIQPTYIVGENVFGLINWSGGLVFEQVQADLEAEGYEVAPVILPVCGVNAPHRRERIWFVAYNNDRDRAKIGLQAGRKEYLERHERNRNYSNSKRERLQKPEKNKQYKQLFYAERNNIQNATPHTPSNGLYDQPATGNNANGQDNKQSGTQRISTIEGLSDERDAPNTCNTGLQRSENEGIIGKCRKNRNEQPTRCFLPKWQNFPTQPPVCSGDDGLYPKLDGITFPKWRNESIKAYGNAIVPQVVYQIFKAIQEYENCTD